MLKFSVCQRFLEAGTNSQNKERQKTEEKEKHTFETESVGIMHLC